MGCLYRAHLEESRILFFLLVSGVGVGSPTPLGSKASLLNQRHHYYYYYTLE